LRRTSWPAQPGCNAPCAVTFQFQNVLCVSPVWMPDVNAITSGARGTARMITERAVAAAFNDRGNGFRMAEKDDRAIADYSQAIQVDPTYAFAFKIRGSIYQRQGDLDRAIADYSEAIRLQPTFAMAFADRASAYQEKGDFGPAIADFSTLIRRRCSS